MGLGSGAFVVGDEQVDMSVAEPRPAEPKPRRHWHQYSLRGLMLVVTSIALSCGLVRTGYLLMGVAGYTGPICWLAGWNLLAGTVGGSIGRLANSRHGGIVGAVVGVIVLWFVASVVFVSLAPAETCGESLAVTTALPVSPPTTPPACAARPRGR